MHNWSCHPCLVVAVTRATVAVTSATVVVTRATVAVARATVSVTSATVASPALRSLSLASYCQRHRVTFPMTRVTAAAIRATALTLPSPKLPAG